MVKMFSRKIFHLHTTKKNAKIHIRINFKRKKSNALSEKILAQKPYALDISCFDNMELQSTVRSPVRMRFCEVFLLPCYYVSQGEAF